MQKISCLIVEDEPLAAMVIQDYISQIPFLEWKGTCDNAFAAMEQLKRQQVDLMFVDIHLPKLRGLDFIRTLSRAPQVIITTAYREYALDGYELNVVDYLLKPVSLNRFMMAVNKVRANTSVRAEHLPAADIPERKSVVVNASRKKIRLYLDEILYVESKREYISIVTAKGKVMTKFQLSDFELLLDKAAFLRIHRSFIVSLANVRSFSATDVEINSSKIPIGRSYKELVLSVLEQKS
ncbi:MAG TPA: LytTR family DNA-binding domain-containing protein [Chitinophagaceae bacterium]|nr:LytTR family DNA-binding domain-containing protein [Chitinophagaceae bacterium]